MSKMVDKNVVVFDLISRQEVLQSAYLLLKHHREMWILPAMCVCCCSGKTKNIRFKSYNTNANRLESSEGKGRVNVFRMVTTVQSVSSL